MAWTYLQTGEKQCWRLGYWKREWPKMTHVFMQAYLELKGAVGDDTNGEELPGCFKITDGAEIFDDDDNRFKHG